MDKELQKQKVSRLIDDLVDEMEGDLEEIGLTAKETVQRMTDDGYELVFRVMNL